MQVIDLNSSEYPPLLKATKNPPKELYIKGDYTPQIFENCLSVVGSRKMTLYGQRVTQRFVREVASCGITIVSGFMYGVDAEAHEAALSVGGKTVAVMACGIDEICPAFQKDLYNSILETGSLAISEYSGSTQARKWTFPQRNRIVAGLSQALLVVEAGYKSGTLITAKCARDYGRQVFVAPGDVFSSNYKGICRLIKEGAKVVTSGLDIAKYYNADFPADFGTKEFQGKLEIFEHGGEGRETSIKRNLDPIEEKIYSLLENSSLNLDDLVSILEISPSSMSAKITSLSLKGLITEKGGIFYVN